MLTKVRSPIPMQIRLSNSSKNTRRRKTPKLSSSVRVWKKNLISLEPEERAEYLNDLGVSSSGVDQMIKSAYKLLGLMSFLTAGEKEVRAWTIPVGTKAPKAAGEIHSDIERGFIRAEIVSYDDLVRTVRETAASEKGLMRLEGKEYVMQEGDVVDFRFNV